MSKYGITYKGSKDKIIESIAMNFPKAKHFYDLFGGGFSVTHCMLVNKSNKYEHFHYNEINSNVVEQVKKAINGDYSYDKFTPAWISREEFHKKKDVDVYVGLCWGFGAALSTPTNNATYSFGENIEPYKKSMHMAVVFNEFDGLSREVLGFSKWPKNVKSIPQKRAYLRQKIEWYRKTNTLPKVLYKFLSEDQSHRARQDSDAINQLQRLGQLERLERLQQLEKLQQLGRLERLQQLEQVKHLERLHITSLDYREVEILPSSVVYCDIPYKGTEGYNEFSHDDFFEWAATRDFPVYISEYEIPDSRFTLVYCIDKLALFNHNKKNREIKVEKLYWNGVKT